MSDPTNPVAAPSAPATPPTPAQPAPAAPALEEHQRMSRDAFNARIAEASEAGFRKALKELGADKIDDAKARLSKAAELEQAQLTESQKLQKQLDELSPRAKRAAELETILDAHAKAQFEALPASLQKYVASTAGEDAAKRLAAINAARESGLFDALAGKPADAPAPALPARDPKPATTLAPPGPATPKPAGTLTPYETHRDLQRAGKTALAAQYFAAHRKAIDASAPKP